MVKKSLFRAFWHRITACFIFLLILLATSVAVGQNTYLDTFGLVSYSENNGNSNFSSDWIEFNDDGGVSSPSTGKITITSGVLYFDDIDKRYIERSADLSGATSATLSLDYDATKIGDEGLYVLLWNDVTSSYDLVATIDSSLPATGSLSISLSAAQISNVSTIRFIGVDNKWGKNDEVSIDNVRIDAFFTASVTINDVTVDEGVSAVFSVTLNVAVSGGFTIDFTTFNGTATAGSDYAFFADRLTFVGTAGESQSITVPTNTDFLFEGDEFFEVNISTGSTAVVIDDSQGIATITDLNLIQVPNGGANACSSVFTDSGGFSGNYAINENYTFTICPDNGGSDLTVNFTSFDVEDNYDFLSIYNGMDTSSLISTHDNGNPPTSITSTDPSGCLTFVFSSDSTVTGTGWTADISCSAPSTGLSITNVVVDEGQAAALFTVTYNGAAIPGGFTVDYATMDVSAIAGIDYTAYGGILTFVGDPNESQTISINLTDDADVENDEQFNVALSNVSAGGPVITNPTGIGIIRDNDLLINQPLVLVEQFNGYTDYVSTGNTLRADPDSIDPCTTITASSNTLTSPMTPGATVEKAYLYWAHSGADPDLNVTFEGVPVKATRAYKTFFGFPFYSLRADVTSIVSGITDPSNNIFDFTDLTIDNGPNYCGSTVLGGWSLIVFYSDDVMPLPTASINLYEGFVGQQNSLESYPLDGFFANNINGAKATFLSWEGDADISGGTAPFTEELSITNQAGVINMLSGDGGQTGDNAYNSTIYDNTVSPIVNNTTTFGLDLDTYDISGLIGVGDNTITANMTAGGDFMMPNVVIIKVPSNIISGIVFEDTDYGGGVGRDYATSGSSPIAGAVVELYDGSGLLVQSTTTDASGEYLFGGMDNGNYTVRVVNNTVKSNRAGGDTCASCMPVQTYRREFTGVGNGTPMNIVDEVGGKSPSSEDTAAGVLLGAQSVTAVTISSEGLVGVDFGFNFNTIVNTNPSGQGSLSQFIENVNNLGNTGLDIVANGIFDPAAEEDTTIFMIPPTSDPQGRTADANFSGGVFSILQSTLLPKITDLNTHIDGRTQTAYSGDTNTGAIGATENVGVNSTALPNYGNPEIFVSGSTVTGAVFRISGAGSMLANLAIGSTNDQVGVELSGTVAAVDAIRVEGNFIGTNASGTAVGSLIGLEIKANTSVLINGNYISGNTTGTRVNGGVGTTITNNYFDSNNPNVNCTADAISIETGTNITILNNLIENSGATGIDMFPSFLGSALIDQNTIKTSGQASSCTASSEIFGISLYGSDNIVSGNMINNNAGAGIVAGGSTAMANLITQNSIFANGTLADALGIDINATGNDNEADGVTLNDSGDADTGTNELNNFPVFQSVSTDGISLFVKGWARPGTIIELFISDVGEGTAAQGDNRLGLAQDYGEGQTYLATVTEGSASDLSANIGTYTDPDGNTDNTNEFQFKIPLSSVIPGITITATATLANSTSEFSPPFAVRVNSVITNRQRTYRVKKN